MKRLARIALVAGCVLGFTGRLSATNGYFATGYGTESKGMAGAGVALVTDTLAPALNPAATVFVPDRWDLGAGLFAPDRTYSVFGQPSGFPGTFGLAPGPVTSGSRYFVVPSLGIARRAGANGAFGLAMYGNGGMNTNYRAQTFGVSPTGVDLSQMFIAPTYARRFGDRHAIGFTGVLAYQRFEARGLQAFAPFSVDDDCLSNNKHANAFGGGLRVGYLGRWSDAISIGASYQSRIWMRKFEPYQGLFAGAGGFDIPSSWTAGVAVKPVPSVDVLADIQQIRYSEVNSIGNTMLPNLMQAPLGTDGGAGFGWRDMTIYKVGVQHRAGRDWSWRAGYSFGRQPIPSSEVLFNILAPGVEEQHVAFGVSRELGHGRGIRLAVTRALSHTVTGPNPLEVPGGQRIDLEMHQWDVQIGYTATFGK